MSDGRETPALTIDVVEPDRASARVVAAGDVDLASAPALVDAVLSSLGDHRSVHLDLSGVTFLDSSGIHALMRLARAGDDTTAVTISPDLRPQVRKVLEVSGVMPMLPFEGT